ncbi:hypothetical protein [Pseudomonas sp. MUP55]|uniref:hypothetical protein n=1 Tax=Pseudomonas sp. MUP55 TaxID=3087234 RepID=UPI002A5AA8C5|nr:MULTISPECIES: hypothetical protein [unclassified Pseudomonas]WPN93566.1 hypothetical protein SC319_04120 [Pseudomonas sp. MUP56]WPN99092.1 hypothetical protein SC318_04120 [Pseudomonas sp. MUP55]
MSILSIRLQKVGGVGPTAAALIMAIAIGVATILLTRFGLNIQATQFALSLCAGWALPGAYGASLKEHGLKRLWLSVLLVVALFFSSTPIRYLLLGFIG